MGELQHVNSRVCARESQGKAKRDTLLYTKRRSPFVATAADLRYEMANTDFYARRLAFNAIPHKLIMPMPSAKRDVGSGTDVSSKAISW